MSEAQIHLTKTLCAMRWIYMMTGRTTIAQAIETDLANLEAAP